MNLSNYRIVLLDKSHDRKTFDCGNDILNHYFTHQASQDVKRRANSCYVVVDKNNQVAGFYTLCSASMPYHELNDTLKKKLARYRYLPAVLIERLAIDIRHKGQGLGSVLLANAIKQATQSPIASSVIIVEAKDDNAIAFYRHFGFLSFVSVSDKLYYPLT
ncbi:MULTISPECIES: GNAT family N-acetyltransferase [Moraxella]|uniref:N-acetyltransferase domain-containing protein n=1 Tax=Moraxella lacunata TaxID=477 RepID=A0A1B8Q8E2_MORLA|nr:MULTISPECIES: GNAT family N-acetyltransferase [Moraxella]MBE9578150.1 GNAT family N-acetyltransferase [Moraxella sp. K1664]MBE9587655.1 GNAT family N-acetyltransferase [Moraxella sp. K1630]MBE9595852.1 GNAT family N-acetyltransferase [Moraxella sp. K2450]MDH9219215.1 GNAT family N-acetyltransferase [Moraxella lacunata]MDI4482197.1 GNAT family N-acetyltransferase [Moraxella lacunata]